jgi:hypothetical protein
MSARDQAKLLKAFRKVFDDKDAAELSKHEWPCRWHVNRVAYKVDLIYSEKGLTTLKLYDRIMTLARSNSIGDLKAGRKFSWFRKETRPLHRTELRGVWRIPQQSEAGRAFIFGEAERDNLIANLTAALPGFRSAYDEYQTTGNAIFPVFAWWGWVANDGGTYNVSQHDSHWTQNASIMQLIKLKYEVYYQHERGTNRTEGLGWLRNMFHSIGQQLMRTDPLYYCLYVLLRPDHATRLISYPYYTKRAVEGDNTAFKHIDVNIHQLAHNGRGFNQLQGSVSLDDETEKNCTIILPGMHDREKLKRWLSMLESRDQLPADGFVQQIKNEHWGAAEKQVFGVDWTPVPCKAGDARLTSPALPHGSTGKTKGTTKRRTMLPWFVSIQGDHHALEIPESGTWEELSAAHRDQLMGPYTPSGQSVVYGRIPYAFPAGVHLQYSETTLQPLRMAMIGQRRYDTPDVTRCITSLLDKSVTTETFLSLINHHRASAALAARAAFAFFVAYERAAFDDKSVFRRLNVAVDHSAPFHPDELEVRLMGLSRLDPLAMENDDEAFMLGEGYLVEKPLSE